MRDHLKGCKGQTELGEAEHVHRQGGADLGAELAQADASSGWGRDVEVPANLRHVGTDMSRQQVTDKGCR